MTTLAKRVGLLDEEYFKNLFASFSKPEKEESETGPILSEGPTTSHSREWNVVSRMKLSQKIGFLLYLHRTGAIQPGGLVRLEFLQEKASEEALIAGIRFCQRLTTEEKLFSDFRIAEKILNRLPRSRRFRRSQTRRIGVGYRDKGTLPEISSSARRKATEEAFVYFLDLPDFLQQSVKEKYPSALIEDDEWLDLQEIINSDSS